ncbi:MAG: hypothetical protein ABIS26_00050 [Candidatus Paceibacterota bacterium]
MRSQDMTEIIPLNNKIESLATKPFENKGEQEALPEIIEKFVNDFEQKLPKEGTLDYQGPTALRYVGLSTSDLIELHHNVGRLESDAKRIDRNFPMEEEKLRTLREVKRICREILCSQEAIDLIKKWEEAKQDPEIKVGADLATTLGNQMHSLWENIEKLKT